jgi:hypothetical protein
MTRTLARVFTPREARPRQQARGDGGPAGPTHSSGRVSETLTATLRMGCGFAASVLSHGYPAMSCQDLTTVRQCHPVSRVEGKVVMSRARRVLVGVVAMLSLLGVEGTVHAATPNSISATVWCC